jgi:phosphoribosylamine--glycine ligase
MNNGQVRTNGGRVLCVVGLGESVADAQRSAYASVAAIQWDDAYFRKDIGHRAVRRSSG